MNFFTLFLLGIGGLILCGGIILFFRFKKLASESTSDRFLENPYYSLEDDEILYSSYYPVPANAEKFFPLDDHHPLGKDESIVFYKDKPILEALAQDYHLITQSQSLYYGTDGKKVFINQYVIKEADPQTFEVFKKTQFAHDEKNVYYQGKKVSHAHSLTFQALEGDYGRDKHQYFLRRTPIDISAVPKSVLSDTLVSM